MREAELPEQSDLMKFLKLSITLNYKITLVMLNSVQHLRCFALKFIFIQQDEDLPAAGRESGLEMFFCEL